MTRIGSSAGTRGAAALLTMVLVSVGARAQEGWSRFRGPNGTGVSATTGLPTAIGPETNVVWKTALPPGHSSPIVTASRIFLTGSKDDELLTLALDRATGKELWRRAVPRERASKLDHRNDPAAPSAVADEQVVITFFNDFGLVAYDHAGEELWRHALGPFNNEYGMGASPILVDDRVFLVCDQSLGSFVIALAKKDGKVAWRVDRPQAGSGHSTPIVYRPEEGAPQLVVPGSFLLDSYDTVTGERVWWVSGLSFEMKSVPVLADGVIYINGYGSPLNQPENVILLPPFAEALAQHDANADGLIAKPEMPASRAVGFFDFCDRDRNGTLDAGDWAFLRASLASKNGLLAIRVGGLGDMTEKSVLWTYHRSVPQLPSPLLYGGVLWVLQDQGGIVIKLHPATGEVIEKGRLEDGIDNYYASPVAADGKMWFVGESGLVTVLAPGEGFAALAHADLDELCYATPAIADSRLYLRTRSALYCFGSKSD